MLDSCGLPSNDLTRDHLEHFFTLRTDNEALGCIGLEIYGEHALLRSLAVLQNIRGKGFGKLLVEQIEQYAKEQDIDDIYLLTTTAEGFFAKLGYSTINREEIPSAVKKSEEFSSICPDSAAAMVKTLADL
jgi:amino-acid N-acetyltransferase